MSTSQSQAPRTHSAHSSTTSTGQRYDPCNHFGSTIRLVRRTIHGFDAPFSLVSKKNNNGLSVVYQCWSLYSDGQNMITAPQLRAARALLGIGQPTLAQRAGLSLPTIQRMETSGGLIRGNVDSLTKVVQALEDMGVELLGEGSVSAVGGRGVRLRDREVRVAQMSAQQRPDRRMTVNLSVGAADGGGQSD